MRSSGGGKGSGGSQGYSGVEPGVPPNLNYRQHVVDIKSVGHHANPRGLPVVEVYNKSSQFTAGEMIRRQGINYKLGFMEGLQLLAGVFNKVALGWVAPNADLSLFSDQSAYGPRVVGQVERAIVALNTDPETRRAVVMLARPHEGGSENMPCTLAVQFQVRNLVLGTTITMRSSDAMYGIPYDVMQFGMLAQAVARCIGVPGTRPVRAGYLDFQLANAHIYTSTGHLAPLHEPGYHFLLNADVPTKWTDITQWAHKRILRKYLWEGGVPKGITVTEGSDYEVLEKEHLGDSEKQTGIYAPKGQRGNDG